MTRRSVPLSAGGRECDRTADVNGVSRDCPERANRSMSDSPSKSAPHHEPPPTHGMRIVFWGWTALIFSGLAVMLVLPLAGR